MVDGQIDAALQLLDKAECLAEEVNWPRLRAACLAFRMHLLIAEGGARQETDYLHKELLAIGAELSDKHPHAPSLLIRFHIDTGLGRYYLSKGNTKEALNHFSQCLQALESHHQTYLMFKIWSPYACALFQAGQRTESFHVINGT